MSKLKKLPADCTFPQLGIVLDAERFAACLQAQLCPESAAGALEVRSVKVKRVYYKPGRSCRLTFTAKMRAGDRKGEQLYFAKIVPDAKLDSTFRRAARAALTAPEFGPPVARLATLSMVLWAYPNDPNLPGLSLLASRDAVVALVQRDPAAFGLPAAGRLMDLRLGVGKYVPGQRCGYRYRVRWWTANGDIERCFYGKAYQAGLGGPAHAVLAQLAASAAVQSGALRIPMPYGYDAAHEIVWQEMLPGTSFAKETSLARLAEIAAPVADALAAFHAAPLALPAGLGMANELEELAASTAKIARAYPQYAARCAGLEQRLVRAVADLEPVPAAPVHGSFKTSHMFDAGGQVAFIDFDGAGIGDPTYDVGRFLAHLAVASLDCDNGAASLELAFGRFRDAYAPRVPWGWADRRVRWYTAALLLSSQAYKCVKRMVPDRVEAILAGAESWFPAY